jgi:hypothetical protein
MCGIFCFQACGILRRHFTRATSLLLAGKNYYIFSIKISFIKLFFKFNRAYSNNAVLLTSGASLPMSGSTGSGIFIGKYGAPELIVSPYNIRKIIIAKIPKDIDNYNSKHKNQTHINYTLVELDKISFLHYAPPYTRGLPSMSANEHFVRICKSKICCEFTVDYKKLPISKNKKGYTYRLGVFTGQRSYLDIRTGGELFCAIVPCINEKSNGCGQRLEKLFYDAV